MKRLLIILVLLSSSAVAGVPSIVRIELVNETRIPDEQIRAVLAVKEGEPFDLERWEQSLSALKKWGRFREIRGERGATREGVMLKLTVTEGALVSGINLSGTYPFLSSRIRRLVAIHPGDLFDPSQASEQATKIADFYERAGLSGTAVTFTSRIREREGTVDLDYRVHKGDRYRIGTIKVVGTTLFPHGWFVSKINPLRPYQPGRLRESLEKMRDGYREAGYLRARVRLKDLGKDQKRLKVDPVIEVTEGDRVTVRFEGNRRISRRTLKQTIPIFTEGGYSSYEIEESERRIIQLYHARGFREATVSSEKKETGPRRLLIRFRIEEGPETQVKKVRIEGNREISDRKIKKRLRTQEETVFRTSPWRPELVEDDLRNLPQILKGRGALEAKAVGHQETLSRLKDKVSVTFEVEEGPITRLDQILFVGNQAFSESKLRKRIDLKEGKPFHEETLAQDKENLVRYYADRGYPYVTVLHDLKRADGNTRLTFTLQEGERVRIGEILIVGNERTRRHSIERALRFKRGHPFSYRKVIESETSLRRWGTFRSVDIETIGLAEKESVVHLLVRVEESKSIILDLEGSYDTDDQFTGAATINDVNLFGAAKRANVKLTGGRDLQRGELNFIDPALLGYNFEAILSGLVELEQRPGFNDIDVGGSVGLLRELTPQINLFGRYQVIRTFFRNVIDPTEESEQDHTTSKFSLSASYDTRDSYSDPSRGMTALAGLDFSNKIAGTGFNFFQPKGYVAYYLSLGGRATLLNYIRVEGIKVLGGDVLTRDQRVFLGGDYSVRGFDQDGVGPIDASGRPSGGQILLMQTTEFQTRVFKDLKVAFFIDTGSVTESITDVGAGSLRHGAGLGLRYITPVGPLRLDYGFKLDKRSGEDPSRLHFAFGYAF